MTSSSSGPLVPTEIASLEWYHGSASRHVAESLLMQNGRDGSYLLRPSSSRPGDLALSIRCKDSVRHFNVIVEGDQYTFGLAVFNGLKDFLDHFDQQPLVSNESGQLVSLKYPYPRSVVEPSMYEHVRIHGQYGKSAADRSSDLHLAVASKEGYMTKLGGIVKNWKARWFVLLRYELKYFRNQTDKVPVRVLDLRNAAECCADTSQGHSNCLRLVFPWRTFYFICESNQDMKDWVNVLQWKLEHLHSSSS